MTQPDEGATVPAHRSTDDRLYVLCCNCGTILPGWDAFEALIYDDEGERLIPAPEGWSDPLLRCPACKWLHTDDDGNPGMYDGTPAAMEAERERMLRDDPDYADHWRDELAKAGDRA